MFSYRFIADLGRVRHCRRKHITAQDCHVFVRFFYARTKSSMVSSDVQRPGRVTLSRCFLPFQKRIGIETGQRLSFHAVDEPVQRTTGFSGDESGFPLRRGSRLRAGGRSGNTDYALVHNAISVEQQNRV